MYKRILAAILCTAMLAPLFTACSGGNDETPSSSGETTSTSDNTQGTEEETEVTRANMPDNLPSDLDFDGTTINIYHFGSDETVDYDCIGEMGGDVVLDAVYSRNTSVEDRLDVKLNWIAGDSTWDGFPSDVSTYLATGSSDYDVIMEESSRLWQQSIQGYYLNLKDAQYLDLDQPWWYGAMMEESAIDNSRRYFLNGDICLTVMLYASAMYFNKPLFIDNFGDVNALYTAVTDGTWTYDVFADYCQKVYNDTNGNGQVDDNDIMGFRYEQWGIPNYFSMSNGLTYITRDEDGYPVLDILSEQGIQWAETLYKLLYTNNISAEGSKEDTFIAGTSLFYPGQFVTAHALRDVDFEYGMLPYPKLDESLDYMSGAGTANGNGVAVPASVDQSKLNAIYATLEALCAEAYRKVTPSWYDTALKVKYSSGQEDSKMVDIIYEHINCPFIMMADKELNIGSVFTNGVYGSSSEGAFVSYYEGQSKVFNKALENAIEKYSAIEH